MNVQPDARRTSVYARDQAFGPNERRVRMGETEFNELVVVRCPLHRKNAVLGFHSSGTTNVEVFTVVLSSPAGLVSLPKVEARVSSSFSHGGLCLGSLNSGQSESWTVEGVELVTSLDTTIKESFEEMRSLIAAINSGQTLAAADEFDGLLTRAANSQSVPEDIDEWARRLAGDVGNLND